MTQASSCFHPPRWYSLEKRRRRRTDLISCHFSGQVSLGLHSHEVTRSSRRLERGVSGHRLAFQISCHKLLLEVTRPIAGAACLSPPPALMLLPQTHPRAGEVSWGSVHKPPPRSQRAPPQFLGSADEWRTGERRERDTPPRSIHIWAFRDRQN